MHRDQALRDPAKSFLDDLCVWEQFLKGSPAEQAHIAKVLQVSGARLKNDKSGRKRNQLAKQLLRQPVRKRHQRMGIQGEPLVWCLYKEATAAPDALCRELTLAVNAAYMLNH